MPLELGVWRIDGGTAQLALHQLDFESRLEDILADDISIANPDWLLVGRQVRTAFGTRIDLLALDSQGNLVVLELKRDKTPRDIVAQVLEYGAWAKTLKPDDIAHIFDEFQKANPARASARISLDQAFREKFRVREMPEELNESHQLVIVASSLDPTTERVVSYLLQHHRVNINAVFFRVFRDRDREYMARAWLQDPFTVEAESAADSPEPEEWNGEYYGSFGYRNWADAVKYGYFSGGGGRWYSNTLHMLQPGARLWVNIPGTGYVGVGKVEETVVPCEEFMVKDDAGRRVPLLTVTGASVQMKSSKEEPDNAEYVVRVNWLKTVPESEAIREPGFFGNQNTVARPTSEKWKHTIERLKVRLGVA
ncbi:endonuclease NucS domain-containing protein [Anaeromyxobacter sp. PSR-1]|uniref:endonuclease NucS domain-containing protein n=1 Tax=Anaeromyxobacter sp. PSR-1 TaxID=1300915 RepID=UPI0005E58A55|nr:endonuclease NucS domain-containing protein [Anaeromyxobacter sp. PSR-1]GAO02097.1 endonuclease NucS [Anaeromyxobacter sp. PSR-1]